MRDAHDVFAETNPAFCASALAEFTKAYTSVCREGADMPLAYLALPIALSGELAASFERTNKNTGLLEWLERSPQIQLGLAERLNASLSIVTHALRFGCFAQLIVVNKEARIKLGEMKLKAGAMRSLGEPTHVIRHAGRLGFWFATAGSSRTVFDMIGLTV